MKKTLAIIPALAVAFAFSTSFALASDSRVEIKNESEAKVLNNIKSSGNTGYNKIVSEKHTSSRHHSRSISTPVASISDIISGNALTRSVADTYANDTKMSVKVPEDASVKVDNDSEAYVTNNVASSGNSGRNFISSRGNSYIDTGYADARSEAFTVVNSSVIRVK